MYKAEMSIKFLIITGTWRPTNWSLYALVILYDIFIVIEFFFTYSFTAELFTYMIFHASNDVDDFAESLCWFIISFVVSVKMTNLILRRDDIINLIQMLNKDCFQPRNTTEKIMQDKFDFIARKYTNVFFTVTFATLVAITFGGLTKGKDITLPFKASYPYDQNRTTTFWISYFSQCISIYTGGFVSIGFETLVLVLTIQICCQLNIIHHRLQSLSYLYRNEEKTIAFNERDEAKIIKDCVLHHNYIYMFSDKLNDVFSIVFGFQFFGSILNICCLVYSLTTRTALNDKTLAHGLLLQTLFVQIFLYCYAGNEVMLHSLKVADIIDVLDWTMLMRKTKEALLFISLRSSRPIIIKGGPMICMTVDTFVMILRTSYTAYNLLKSSHS